MQPSAGWVAVPLMLLLVLLQLAAASNLAGAHAVTGRQLAQGSTLGTANDTTPVSDTVWVPGTSSPGSPNSRAAVNGSWPGHGRNGTNPARHNTSVVVDQHTTRRAGVTVQAAQSVNCRSTPNLLQTNILRCGGSITVQYTDPPTCLVSRSGRFQACLCPGTYT